MLKAKEEDKYLGLTEKEFEEYQLMISLKNT